MSTNDGDFTATLPVTQPPNSPISQPMSQVMPELTPREEASIYRLQNEIRIWVSKTEHRLQLPMSRWKPRINDTMRATHDCVVDFMREIPEDRRKAVATKLYWLNDDAIVWLALSESLGVSFSTLEQNLYLYPTGGWCQSCGGENIVYRHSRDELLDDKTCPQCAEEWESVR